MKRLLALVFAGFCILPVWAQKTTDVKLVPNKFTSYGITLQPETYKGKQAVRVEQSKTTDSDNRYTLALLNDVTFHNGTIELYLSGQVKPDAIEGARGFVGVVFRAAADTSKFELFYLRPTNGRADDQVRRNHSLQYVSYPGYTWRKLRKEFPEKYESYADIVPGEWTKVKIEVKDNSAKLYVNDASQPNLIVNDLKQGGDTRGQIGLWIDTGTLAHFAELKITKADE